jgi:hypothetical protein
MLKLGHGGMEFLRGTLSERFADVGEKGAGSQPLSGGELVQLQVCFASDAEHDRAKDRL